MRRKHLFGLAIVFLVVGMYGVVNAQSVTLLEDYRDTSSVDDVVHLGDKTYSYFVVPTPQGHTETFAFDVSPELINAEVYLTISHFQANPDEEYYNPILVNGINIGSLSHSPDHWLTEQFRLPAGVLNLTGNTVTINAFKIGNNYDDFEFTNLYLSASLEANAGPDQIICNALCDQVILDGGKSIDLDLEIISYAWELIHRTDTSFNRSASGVSPVLSNLEPGVYDVTLTITNSGGLTDTDVMVLTVQATCNPCSILKGDFDSDGDVDGDDLKIFVGNYGSFPLIPGP